MSSFLDQYLAQKDAEKSIGANRLQELEDQAFATGPSYGGQEFQKTLGASGAPTADPAASSVGTAGSAAALPFMATPAGAGVVVGSQFLSQYLAQKAADARQKRERAAQIAQEHGQAEQRGFDQLINVYKGALR